MQSSTSRRSKQGAWRSLLTKKAKRLKLHTNANSNTYAYVGGNPITGIDSFGLCKCQGAGNAPSPQQYQAIGEAMKGTSILGGPAGVSENLAMLYQFHRGGLLDAQVRYGGSPAYANYVFGVEMSANGMPLQGALSAAQGYAQYSGATNVYKAAGDTMDPNYPGIPASNVSNITQGYNDQKNGILCTLN